MEGTIFPPGFGSGSGISPAHSEFLTRLEQMMHGGLLGGFKLPMRMDNLVIKVDGENGDDSRLNPGTETPLKTLQEAYKRAPLIHSSCKIQIAAGEYVKGGKIFSLSTASGYPLILEGELLVLNSFEIDSIDVLDIYKNSGTTPWIPSEFAGKVIRYSLEAWGELYEFSHHIIDNGQHNLKIAWSSSSVPGSGYWPFMAVPVGTTIEICEIGTRFVEENYETVYFGGAISSKHIVFDSAYFSLHPGSWASEIWLHTCAFVNCSFGLYSQTGLFAFLINCYWENISGTCAELYSGGTLCLADPYFYNVPKGIGTWMGTNLWIPHRSLIFAKGCDLIMKCEHDSAVMDFGAGVWADDCGVYCKLGPMSRYQKLYRPLKTIESKQLNTHVFQSQNGFNFFDFTEKNSDTFDLVAASGNDFNIKGVNFSWNDYATTHAKSYSDTWNNMIIG